MPAFPSIDPLAEPARASDLIDTVIVPRSVDLGDFQVRRALPSDKRQMVGPFIFFDQFGPAEFLVGRGIDVRPHPHIGLATVTYMFEGEIDHRDNLGNYQPIRPGEVNWMTAGRGIAHSERTGAALRATGSRIYGIQTWIALPREAEEVEPGFSHHDRGELPLFAEAGARVRLIAGSLYGATAPSRTFSDMFYADVAMEPGARLPIDAGHEERSIYTLQGEIEIAGEAFGPGQLLVLRPGDALAVTARTPVRLTLQGGAAMDGPRHLWWNFVSSSKERIEQAKADWRTGRFAIVPGDETEFIPLPKS
jgi:hypothetical protein